MTEDCKGNGNAIVSAVLYLINNLSNEMSSRVCVCVISVCVKMRDFSRDTP